MFIELRQNKKRKVKREIRYNGYDQYDEEEEKYDQVLVHKKRKYANGLLES